MDDKDIKLPFLSRPDRPTQEPTANELVIVPPVQSGEKQPEAMTSQATTNEGDQSSSSDQVPAPNGNGYVFKPFADGSLFRYGAHPDGSGRQALVDSSNVVVGVVANKAVADFLVRGAHCLCCILRDEATNDDKVRSDGKIITQDTAVRPVSGNIKID